MRETKLFAITVNDINEANELREKIELVRSGKFDDWDMEDLI